MAGYGERAGLILMRVSDKRLSFFRDERCASNFVCIREVLITECLSSVS